jgi:hypothetical protein
LVFNQPISEEDSSSLRRINLKHQALINLDVVLLIYLML